MNLIRTVIKFLLLAFIAVAVLQIGAVYLLRSTEPDLAPADLISIMSGSRERIKNGCKVAAEQGRGNLMLINNTPQALEKYTVKFDVPDSVSLLSGGISRSSFEDIHIIVQTALDRNFKSVILVTSDYHLPRALFLMYAYNLSIGHKLRVQYMAPREKTSLRTRLWLLYSEVVKFWGSAAEMSGYLITGTLPLDSYTVMAVRNNLKKILFLVD